MRKSFLISAIFTSLLIISFTTAKAQKESKQFSVGFGLEGGIPVGDAKSSEWRHFFKYQLKAGL